MKTICPLALALGLLLSATAALAQTPLHLSLGFGYWSGNAGSPQVIFTDTLGAAASLGPRLTVSLRRSSNPAPPPPYRVRIDITRGFHNVVPISLPAGAVCQQATGGGSQATVIDCVLSTQIAGTPVALIFALDAGPLADFGGSNAQAQATVDSDTHPLPEPPECVIGSTQTGCTLRPVQVFQSRVGLTSMTTTNPMTIGASTLIRINHWVVGYDSSRISTTDIDLPAELEFLAVQNITSPFHTCTSAPHAGGERVSCEGNLRHASATGAVRSGYFSLFVRTRPGVEPPGPLHVVAQIGNGAQPAPGNCLQDPDQDTCAELGFGLVPPPVVDLRFGEWSVPEPWLHLGRPQGPLFVRYRNAGGLASANPVRILTQLPPGFALTSGTSVEGPVTCSAVGAVAQGQTVTCLRSSLAANSTSPSLSLSITGDPAFVAPAGNVAVLAITDVVGNDNQALLTCASNPDDADCLWLPFDVRPPCPGDPVDSLYCDDFEIFEPPQP